MNAKRLYVYEWVDDWVTRAQAVGLLLCNNINWFKIERGNESAIRTVSALGLFVSICALISLVDFTQQFDDTRHLVLRAHKQQPTSLQIPRAI